MKCFYAISGALIFISCLGQALAQSSKACLSYEPAVVTLTGTVTSKTYPGPPNFESIRAGDEPETYWLLALLHPVCVNQGEPGDLINEAKKNIRRIQLVFNDEEAYKKYRRLLGTRIVATGMLYASFSGHHKTPVLLRVNGLTKATIRRAPGR